MCYLRYGMNVIPSIVTFYLQRRSWESNLLLRVNAAIVNCIVLSQWPTFFVTENTNSCVYVCTWCGCVRELRCGFLEQYLRSGYMGIWWITSDLLTGQCGSLDTLLLCGLNSAPKCTEGASVISAIFKQLSFSMNESGKTDTLLACRIRYSRYYYVGRVRNFSLMPHQK